MAAEFYASPVFAHFSSLKIDFEDTEATTTRCLQHWGKTLRLKFYTFTGASTKVMKPLTSGSNYFLIRRMTTHQRIALHALK